MNEEKWDNPFKNYKLPDDSSPQKKKGNASERSLVLEEIINELKKENKEVNVKLVAIKTSHIPTKDLYAFKSICLDYKRRGKGNFSKCFYGSLKVKE
jgi:hypothetical protein